jgi:hypothetical protein
MDGLERFVQNVRVLSIFPRRGGNFSRFFTPRGIISHLRTKEKPLPGEKDPLRQGKTGRIDEV